MDPEYKAEGILMKAYAADALKIEFGVEVFEGYDLATGAFQRRTNVISYDPCSLNAFLDSYFRNEAFVKLDDLLPNVKAEMPRDRIEEVSRNLQMWTEVINYLVDITRHDYSLRPTNSSTEFAWWETAKTNLRIRQAKAAKLAEPLLESILEIADLRPVERKAALELAKRYDFTESYGSRINQLSAIESLEGSLMESAAIPGLWSKIKTPLTLSLTMSYGFSGILALGMSCDSTNPLSLWQNLIVGGIFGTFLSTLAVGCVVAPEIFRHYMDQYKEGKQFNSVKSQLFIPSNVKNWQELQDEVNLRVEEVLSDEPGFMKWTELERAVFGNQDYSARNSELVKLALNNLALSYNVEKTPNLSYRIQGKKLLTAGVNSSELMAASNALITPEK